MPAVGVFAKSWSRAATTVLDATSKESATRAVNTIFIFVETNQNPPLTARGCVAMSISEGPTFFTSKYKKFKYEFSLKGPGVKRENILFKFDLNTVNEFQR